MAIQEVDYSHLTGLPHEPYVPFAINVSYPGEKPKVFFTEEQFQADRRLLETPTNGRLRTFVIGAFTALFDPSIGCLPPDYEKLIRSIHGFYEETRLVEPYSCFVRERFGRIGITSDHATVLDRLALDTSDFLTLLPGASHSPGTWKEIKHASTRGTRIVGLFKEDQPDLHFQAAIMREAANGGANSPLTFITFNSPNHLFEQLHEVTRNIHSMTRSSSE